MKDKRYDYEHQLANAKDMAKRYNRPVRVFSVYMPSVYRVDRSPLTVEIMPHWHDGKEEAWIKDNLRMAATVVLPDGTVQEPPREEKPKRKRKNEGRKI